jgi:CheY-like chemotaxis protein
MRIVIAEDSAIIRAGLAEILADRGHVVVAAAGNAGDLQSAVDETLPRARCAALPGIGTCRPAAGPPRLPQPLSPSSW